MSAIPITRIQVSAERADSIRARVRKVQHLPGSEPPSGLAQAEDATAFYAFLSDPDVHAPIYNLPSPLSVSSVAAFIAKKREEQARGEGLLFLRRDDDGEILGYSELHIWPDWAAGELGGAIRPDQQNRRVGSDGARKSFAWMFEALDLDLICETAALENVRTANLLDHLGFRRRGQVQRVRPDGRERPSLVWEITRLEWTALQNGL